MFVSVVIPVWNGERSHSIYTSLHTDRIPFGLEMGYRIRSLLFGDLRLSEDAEHCKSLIGVGGGGNGRSISGLL